jgi:hypothetical protein
MHVAGRQARMLLALTAGLAVTCAPRSAASQPTTAPTSQASPPRGRFVPLDVGVLYVPASFAPTHDGAVDLLVHFHGHPDTAAREFDRLDAPGVLVIVNYPGLSSAYAGPFRDEALFGRVLANALNALNASRRSAAPLHWGRIDLSSFSAGYGAVREILAVPRYVERVDGYVAADSIYAGYVERDGANRVNPENMTAFRRFAELAAAGRKTFIASHSYLEPGSYAGTHETADYLIAHVHAPRRPSDDTKRWKPFHVVSRADRGRFHVFGCTGTDGQAHMQHLRHIARWWQELRGASIPSRTHSRPAADASPGAGRVRVPDVSGVDN